VSADLAGRRVLVTGGTGFIGGRLVEKLVLELGARVRVITSNYANAARVSRFDLELLRGDVTDAAFVAQAAEGCDAIFHCAYGGRGSDAERRRVTVESARAVLEAAAGAPAGPRVVVTSTMVVYGVGVEGPLDERAPRRRSGITYADAKIAAEAIAFDYARNRGVKVSVVQPTAVYGPYGPSWTARVLQDLKAGLVVLVDGGAGYANPVYVDDVVAALLLAATKDEAVGEAFLVSGGETVTWRDFYRRFEAMLGFSSTVEMSRAEAKAHYARSHRRRGLARELVALVRESPANRARLAGTREVAALYPLAKRLLALHLLPSPAPRARGATGAKGGTAARKVHAVHPQQVDFLAAKTDVRIDKARRLLGYEPAFDFERGAALTEAWARWANLVGQESAA